MTEQEIGPYRVVRKLGEGGMGAIFEAVHRSIERRVAIKILHPEYSRNTEMFTRFVNEARAVNWVSHPGIVEIFDHGRLADGTAYLVMELLAGETLASRLRSVGHGLAVPDMLPLGLSIAEALVAAHAKGVVHRDLKPDNVMIVPAPHLVRGERTKLLDFGIAKLADGAPDQLKTAVNAFLGTPSYMSPEQCLGAGRVGDQADVYSLGVMFYEMLAGGVPFAGTETGEILCKHLYELPPALTAVAPAVPLPLAALVHSMLAKEQHQRPSMSQVLATLNTLAASPVETVSTLVTSTDQARPHRFTRQRLATSSAAAVATLLALLGAYTLLNPRREAELARMHRNPNYTAFIGVPSNTTKR